MQWEVNLKSIILVCLKYVFKYLYMIILFSTVFITFLSLKFFILFIFYLFIFLLSNHYFLLKNII